MAISRRRLLLAPLLLYLAGLPFPLTLVGRAVVTPALRGYPEVVVEGQAERRVVDWALEL